MTALRHICRCIADYTVTLAVYAYGAAETVLRSARRRSGR